jgi:hypothetical protein
LSMACRNPRRGLMCEPPAVKRIDYYCHSDLSLAGFIVAAAPHTQKRCQVTVAVDPAEGVGSSFTGTLQHCQACQACFKCSAPDACCLARCLASCTFAVLGVLSWWWCLFVLCCMLCSGPWLWRRRDLSCSHLPAWQQSHHAVHRHPACNSGSAGGGAGPGENDNQPSPACPTGSHQLGNLAAISLLHLCTEGLGVESNILVPPAFVVNQ